MQRNLITLMTIAVLCLVLSGTGLARGGHGRGAGSNRGGNPAAMISSLPREELSAAEKADLLKMVEEEKLARDVYVTLYEKWTIPAFNNISRAEQRHMDAVAALLDKYDLANPVAGLEPGIFATAEVQDLYRQLVDRGRASEEEALRVGGTIEDLDIKDLQTCLENVDNQDVTMVFNNLMRGSENHLRAFTSLLSVYGYTPYEAQFLSPEEIDEILSSPPTRGQGRGRGRNCQPGQCPRQAQ